MKTWIIEPRDPFIARDGKPFTAIPGSRATSLQFPFPSTTTGGVRTRAGLSNGAFNVADPTLPKTLREKVEVRGPLLVRLGDRGDIVDWYAPAPADAVLFGSAKACLRQLSPRDLPEGALTNLPYHLQPVYLTAEDKSKPCSKPPRFWRWDELKQWLLDPATIANKVYDLPKVGQSGPVLEWRTHVKINSASQTAQEGALFQTRGLEFTCCAKDQEQRPKLSEAQRLAFAVNTNADEKSLGTDEILAGLSHLGGERRIVCWRESGSGIDLFNSRSTDLPYFDSIVKTRRCRVVLLTPAHFKAGVMPTSLCDEKVHGFRPQLKAIANGRYQVVSGWDFERDTTNPKWKHGKPKPTRRLVPAGAVYWLDLSEAKDNNQIEAWIAHVWMRSVSDDEQDQRDGFGLAVLGTWEKQAEARA